MIKHMDRHDRRNLIELTPVPQPRHDALVVLNMEIDGIAIRLRYVPDRDLIGQASFAKYLHAAFAQPAASLLAQAQTVLEDVSDQVIPCWLEVRLERSNGDGLLEQAIIEDKQPRWNDPGVLTRIGP